MNIMQLFFADYDGIQILSLLCINMKCTSCTIFLIPLIIINYISNIFTVNSIGQVKNNPQNYALTFTLD